MAKVPLCPFETSTAFKTTGVCKCSVCNLLCVWKSWTKVLALTLYIKVLILVLNTFVKLLIQLF